MTDDIFSSQEHCEKAHHLCMSDRVYNAMTTLRQFLYENVYRSERVHQEFVKAKKILTELYLLKAVFDYHVISFLA